MDINYVDRKKTIKLWKPCVTVQFSRLKLDGSSPPAKVNGTTAAGRAPQLLQRPQPCWASGLWNTLLIDELWSFKNWSWINFEELPVQEVGQEVGCFFWPMNFEFYKKLNEKLAIGPQPLLLVCWNAVKRTWNSSKTIENNRHLGRHFRQCRENRSKFTCRVGSRLGVSGSWSTTEIPGLWHLQDRAAKRWNISTRWEEPLVLLLCSRRNTSVEQHLDLMCGFILKQKIKSSPENDVESVILPRDVTSKNTYIQSHSKHFTTKEHRNTEPKTNLTNLLQAFFRAKGQISDHLRDAPSEVKQRPWSFRVGRCAAWFWTPSAFSGLSKVGDKWLTKNNQKIETLKRKLHNQAKKQLQEKWSSCFMVNPHVLDELIPRGIHGSMAERLALLEAQATTWQSTWMVLECLEYRL